MTSIYVDADDGNDANDGLSEVNAVETIGAANIIMATYTAAASEDIEVLFKRGQVHNHTATTELDNTDNRPSGYRLSYGAYGGGSRPVITARTAVTGWTVTADPNIVVADLAGEIRNLWTDDSTKILKRATWLEDYEPTRVHSWDEVADTVTIPTWALPVGGVTTGLEIIIQMGWSQSRLPVASVAASAVPSHTDVTFSTESKAVEFAKGDLAHAGLGTAFAYGPFHNNSGQRFFWCNAQEFLYTPGDWFHDEVAEKLYVFLPSGVSTAAEFEALGIYITNGIETIFKINGLGAEFDTPLYAENIDIKGLEFKHIGYTPTVAAEGHIGYISGFGLYNDGGAMAFREIPAAINTPWMCKSISVTDCYFHDLGGCGIRGNYGLQGLKIAGNAFARIAAAGVINFGVATGNFGGGPFSFDRIPESGQNIYGIYENNIFVDIGEYYLGASLSIGAWFNARVNNNLIKDGKDQGIMVSNGARWYGGINLRNIKVMYNDIDTVLTRTVDGAGIYSSGNVSGFLVLDNQNIGGPQKGLEIYGNRLQNIITSGWDPGGSSANGIYLDLGSQGSLVYTNSLDNVSTAFQLNAVSYNSITFNRLTNIGSDLDVHYSGMNIFIPGTDTPFLVQPPLANPPSGTDFNKFYGVGLFSFKAMIPTFDIPEDVITTGGVYLSEAKYNNNGASIDWGVTDVGPSTAMLTEYAELIT